MTISMFNKLAGAAVAATLMLASASASAALIQGTLTFSGDIILDDADTLGTTDALRFIGSDFDVDGATEDFVASGVAQGDFGTISDFDFALNLVPTPTISIADLSFTLMNVDVVAQTGTFLLLTGFGTITGNGFDATDALFSLSANTLGHLNVYSGSITAVPAPGALWLLGSALVALGSRRRNG